MDAPIVSIITVVYNAEATLEATLKSVLDQQTNLFEYWIIDGGSTDRSIEIIRKYESQLTGWFSEPDEGIYDAMNKGINRANGKWLYFLGADDLLIKGILSKVVPYLSSDLSVVFGDVRFDSGRIMQSQLGLRCLLENRLHHQGTFYNRSLFNDFRYNPKFTICADYELTLRIYLQKLPSHYIPYTIAIFASGGKSNKLTSKDINAIRGLYLRTPFLNSLMSFTINSYYTYFRLKVKTKQKLSSILKYNISPLISD